MKPITRAMIDNKVKKMREEFFAEAAAKGVKPTLGRDVYKLWEQLIKPPYSGDNKPSDEECTLRTFSILVWEIERLIREKQSIYVNLLIDKKSFFGATFCPTAVKMTKRSVIVCGAAAALEISWEHIDSVELDSVSNGFLLGKAEESGHSLIWCIDWVGFPQRKE